MPTSVCNKTVYLTFDTGNMAMAETIAAILQRQQVQATFFVANEKTSRGDFSLDDSWRSYWQKLAQAGHHFGSHTYDHLYFQGDGKAGFVRLKPQFGADAGIGKWYDAPALCAELKRVDGRFHDLTGRHLEPIWRAPGGRTSARLIALAEQCGFQHIAWSRAGFLGDELDSGRFPNAVLLEQASRNIQDGDIAMAHLGIWSRKEAWAPAVLEPLIDNLKQRGFCFATLPVITAKSLPLKP
ncbi:polysaccharide deacetylase family protein [Polynucleobacter sp. IMCC 30228]|uniref:polysaccharide deacetylase family protein n=1 Tax=Polynucleobacter sp. IMCC 30228 TaxID=2781011 RepID=UPI001F1E4B99|nr:polysaccharide deacetylase family protein [Polynucleobacter sp. IMCC 30228]MCE7527167.1 polysaccharide deacetylase family protein [Polynucleobacter sp. IMCC 30228]